MSIAFIFPGQGSQAIGMLSELAAEFPSVQQSFSQASDVLGVDMWKLAQEGPIETLSMTENTQPALLTAGYAVWQVWNELGGEQPQIMAGHSLGEYTALVCAGALSFEDGVSLVRDRGKYMQEAVPSGQGGMAALLGLDNETVQSVCEENAQGDVLQAVNFNAPGQVVIAGSAAAIERAVVAAKDAGARRAMPLPVSIPAHSSLMTPASERLAERIAGINLTMPSIPVLHNCNVSIANSVDEVAQNLVTQLDSPVRWVESVEAMQQQGAVKFVESGPGKVLSGLVKRIVKDVSVHCVETSAAIKELVS